MMDLVELGDFAAEIVDRDTIALVAWYKNGRILTVNPPFNRLFGFTVKELDGMRWPRDFCTESSCESIIRAMDELEKGGKAYHREVELQGKGWVVPAIAFVHLYKLEAGAEPIFYSFLTDIRDRIRMEQRLKDEKELSQRYLDLMAHDINNFNQTILGHLELALDRVKSADVRDDIQESIDAVMSSAELIRNVSRMANGLRKEK